jgi:hypothetical protein
MESKTNRYGRLMIKHWKEGNEKLAKYYHKKIHEILEKERKSTRNK